MLIRFIKAHAFLISIILCNFFVGCEYGVVRPASNSLFLAFYGANWLPYSWLLVVPFNLLVVALYNKSLSQRGCLKTLFALILLIIGINSFSAWMLFDIPYLNFFQNIWKDVYFLLMCKNLWSLIHTTIDTSKAKFLYGMLFSILSGGAIMGGLLASLLATELGSQNLLFLTLPFYAIILIFYIVAFKQSKMKVSIDNTERMPEKSWQLIKNSPLLIFVLLIVLLMQVSMSLVEYQFNFMLESNIPDVDIRTCFSGEVLSIINMISIVIGTLLVGVLVHLLGLKVSHLLVPLSLGVNSLILLLSPTFSIATYAQIYAKTTDYSFFNAIKEMLYLPMKVTEKFKAKAVIDVFVCRFGRASGAILTIICQAITQINTFFVIGWLSLGIFICWLFLVFFKFKHYEAVKIPDFPILEGKSDKVELKL